MSKTSFAANARKFFYPVLFSSIVCRFEAFQNFSGSAWSLRQTLQSIELTGQKTRTQLKLMLCFKLWRLRDAANGGEQKYQYFFVSWFLFSLECKQVGQGHSMAVHPLQKKRNNKITKYITELTKSCTLVALLAPMQLA